MLEGNTFRGYLSFNSDGPVSYVLSNWDLAMRQYGIYDIFTGTTPYGELVGGSVFNGSLWTLSYEWGCYMIIAALVLFGVLRRARFLVLVLTAFYYVAAVTNIVVPAGAGTILPDFGDRFRVSLALIFLLGSCLALYSKEIKLDDRMGVFSAFVVCATLLNGGWMLLGYPALAYFLLWLAARLPSWLQWIGAKNDYSYGMYVYGFLVQQFTAYLGWYQWGYVPWVAAVIVITAGCAWLSWHIVEKRALALKNWGPGRGIRHWYVKALSVVDWLRHRRSFRATHPAE
jgi:peptidoglycan/LPS O-acetylase OafA/YrhL